MPPPDAKQYPYLSSQYPAIDGLRTVAVLAVFFHHALGYSYPHTLLWWGWCGVDLFFVISGFLITGILVDSRHRANFFSRFYLRRTLRIFPLFYSVWIGLHLLSLFFPAQWHRVLFFSEVYLWNLIPWLPGGATHDTFRISFANFFGHTLTLDTYHFWSLSVEEQFYMLWPLAVWLLNIERLMMLGIASIALLPWLRLWMVLSPPAAAYGFQVVYTSSFTRFDSLLAGALLALWLRSRRVPSPERLLPMARVTFIACVVIFAVGSLLAMRHENPSPELPFVASVGYTLLAGAATSLLALSIHPHTMTARWLSHPAMRHLAPFSYSFYLFHYLPIAHYLIYFDKLQKRGLQLLAPVLLFAATYAASRLSYWLIEQPFLRLKSSLDAPKKQAA